MKTCRIFVPNLTKSGFYSSGFGVDDKYRCESNPKGFYKIVVEPIVVQGNKDKGLIRYCAFKEGYVVEGFGAVITGTIGEIDRKIENSRKEYRANKPKEIVYSALEL